MRGRVLAAGLLVVALGVRLAAQTGPTVDTRVAPATVTVGDPIRLRVAVAHEPGATVTWPEAPDLAPFELIDLRVLDPVADGGRVTSSAELRLTAFELGALTLPAVELAVTHQDGETATVTTEALAVTVESVGRDAAGNIRDIKAPVAIPFDPVTLLPWLAGVATVAAAGWWLYRRARRRSRRVAPAAPAAPPRPAHEIAYESLAALETSGLLELGEVKTFHIRGSDIVRVYVGGRFGIDAMEMTTPDVLDRLQQLGVAGGVVGDVRQLLERCDLVKFAKHRPDPAACRDLVPLARRLVDRTRPPAPAPDEAGTEETRVA